MNEYKIGNPRPVPGFKQCPVCYSHNTKIRKEYRREATEHFPAADMLQSDCLDCGAMFAQKDIRSEYEKRVDRRNAE